MPRPPAATKSATKLLTEYPDLSIILDAWPELPTAVRAAGLALIAASPARGVGTLLGILLLLGPIRVLIGRVHCPAPVGPGCVGREGPAVRILAWTGFFLCAPGSAATLSEPLERGVWTPHPPFGQEMLPCGTHLGSRDGFSFPRAIAARPARGTPLTGAGPPSSGWSGWRTARCSAQLALVTSGADSGPGTLRQAILDAADGATITFAKKVHTITLTTGELDIAKNLDIEGPGANKLTISGNDASRVFDISAGETVTIAGLTITDGLADGNSPVIHSLGGGILNQGDLTLNADVLSNNQAVGATNDTIYVNTMALTGVGVGGGVANLGTLTVSDSTFTGNQARGASGSSNIGLDSFPGAGVGGGLANGGMATSTATVTDCQFTSNLAQGGNGCTSTNSPGGIAGSGAGGAIANFAFGTFSSPGSANLIVSGSNFSNNQAIAGNDNQSADFPGKAIGGAIASHSLLKFGGSTSLDISDSTFDHNEAIGGNHNVVL